MAWVKIDDRFWLNRKVRKAWSQAPASIGLYILALAYCNDCNGNGEDNDGFVDEEWLEMTFATLNGDNREQAVQALADAGLWTAFGDGWQIHDYLDYQPSSKHVQKVRETRRIAGKLGGKKSGQVRALRSTIEAKRKQP